MARRSASGWLAGLLLGLVGCTYWHNMRQDLGLDVVFDRPDDPLGALEAGASGDARVLALRTLREPAAHRGTSQEQDRALALLRKTALEDDLALCRMAAIDALGRFRDPRAARVLEEAYYRAGRFPVETATVLRCQALTSLGQTRQPAGVGLLVRVLGEPPTDGPALERQQKADERIAAARALGNHTHYRATTALVEVLRKENDVALRHCAHESLRESTGQALPADAVAWTEFLQRQGRGPQPPERPGQDGVRWAGVRQAPDRRPAGE